MIRSILRGLLSMSIVASAVSGQASGHRPLRPAADSIDVAPILAAALAEVRRDFAFGRVVLDRVVADSSKRLAPPLVSRREHQAPEGWAKVNDVETVQTELAQPVCNILKTECHLRSDIVGAIGMSDVAVRGDTARVIARTSENTGSGPYKVRVRVFEVTLLRHADGDWKVLRSRIRATG